MNGRFHKYSVFIQSKQLLTLSRLLSFVASFPLSVWCPDLLDDRIRVPDVCCQLSATFRDLKVYSR